MRHVVVRRTALLLGVVFSLGAGLFAWRVSRPRPEVASAEAPATRGATSFRRYCGACHTVDELRPTVVGPPDRREELERFLLEHGGASAAIDRIILDHIAATP